MKRKVSPPTSAVTVLVLAHEGALTLTQCLSCLTAFQQVIVLDWASKDETTAICARYDVMCISENWASPAEQLKQGLALALGSAVLVLEPDELVSEELSQEIDALLSSERAEPGKYLLPRNNIIFGKPLRYGAWSNERFPRLLVRNIDRSFSDRVVGELTQPLTHLHPDKISMWLQKLESATTFTATYVTNRNNPPRPLINLRKRIMGGHLLDGWRGLFTVLYVALFEWVLLRKLRKFA